MTVFEYNQLKSQLACLLTVQKVYPGRTIDNIIDNIQARIKWANENGIGNVSDDNAKAPKNRTSNSQLFDETMEYPAPKANTHPLP